MAVDSGDTEDYAQYYYDARNLRVRKLAGNYNRYTVYGQSGEPIEYRGTNGEWLYNLVYLNGQLLALVYPTVVEDPTDPTDPKPGGGNISSVRDAGPSDGGDDDIVLAAGGGGGETVVYTFVYYHLDHLGTPLAITDASKNIQWSADYYPFGSLYDEQLSVPNDIRFPGQWHDRETGLYYNWHRYYGPHLGRYYQPDPVGLASGDANLYRYVGNRPSTHADPTGLTWLENTVLLYWWITGSGPDVLNFGPGTNQAIDMMDAPEVERAKGFFYKKNARRLVSEAEERGQNVFRRLEPVENFRGRFGVKGVCKAGFDPTEQYLGSYRIDITPIHGGNEIRFVLTNTTSVTSASYGALPSWDRDFIPFFPYFGNVGWIINWTERVAP